MAQQNDDEASVDPYAEELTFQEISHLNDRKQQLKVSYGAYVKEHPEIRSLLNDFMCATLLEKPDNVFHFAANHFAGLQPPEEATGPRYAPLLLTGPEGSGRKSMLTKLEKEFPGMFETPVRHTCRPPLAALGEVDGTHFHFTSKEHMTADIENGKFMHYEADRHGILYGTSYASVEAVVSRSKICVIVCDVDTAMATKDSRRFEELHAVFVRPPTMEALADRLRAIGMDEE